MTPFSRAPTSSPSRPPRAFPFGNGCWPTLLSPDSSSSTATNPSASLPPAHHAIPTRPRRPANSNPCTSATASGARVAARNSTSPPVTPFSPPASHPLSSGCWRPTPAPLLSTSAKASRATTAQHERLSSAASPSQRPGSPCPSPAPRIEVSFAQRPRLCAVSWSFVLTRLPPAAPRISCVHDRSGAGTHRA